MKYFKNCAKDYHERWISGRTSSRFYDTNSKVSLDTSFLIQHAGVDGLANLRVHPRGEDPVCGLLSLRTSEVIFAKVGHVEQGCRRPGGQTFSSDLDEKIS